MRLSEDIYQKAGSTWKISLQRLFVLIFESLRLRDNVDESELFSRMAEDYRSTSEKASLDTLLHKKTKVARIGVANKRQRQALT